MIIAGQIFMIHSWQIITLARGRDFIYKLILEFGHAEVVLPCKVVSDRRSNALDVDLISVPASPGHQAEVCVILLELPSHGVLVVMLDRLHRDTIVELVDMIELDVLRPLAHNGISPDITGEHNVATDVDDEAWP